MRVVFSAAAEGDLESIGDYIARDSPRRALVFLDEIRQACGLLSAHPARFPIAPHAGGRRIRRRVLGPYMIYFEIDGSETQVGVIRILRGGEA